MGRRRRSKGPSWEEQRDEAQLELERAEDALRYRKSQIAEVEAELASLAGPGGWFAAIVGKKATYEAEAQAKLKALNTEVLATRKRLIEARQTMTKFDRAAKKRESDARERDGELEVFAERVRQVATHPLHERLREIETQIQTQADQIFDLDDAMFACAGLSGAIGQMLRATGHAKHWATMDAFYSEVPGMSTMTFLKTRDAQRDAANLPDSIARFNAALETLGLAPMQIEIPDLGSGWDQLFFDNILTDLHHLKRLETFSRRVQDEREMVRETMLWIATKRKAAVDEQTALITRRRAMLDKALG